MEKTAFSVEKRENGALIKGRKMLFWFEPVTARIIRCVCTAEETVKEPSFLMEKREQSAVPAFSVKEEDGTAVFAIEEVTAKLDTETGAITWLRGEKTVLRETARELTKIPVVHHKLGKEKVYKIEKTVDGDRVSNLNIVEIPAGEAYHGKVKYAFEDGEDLFGLGQGENGVYNCRGQDLYLYQTNMMIPIPFLLSSNRYAIYYDCASVMNFRDDCAGSGMWMDTVDQIDTYMLVGDSFDELISGFRLLTGRAVMLPKWAFGYMQSKETYLSQQELVDVAAKYREIGVPLDCMIQDWRTWEPGKWGEKIPDKTRYPNLKAAMDELHGMHVHALVSVWPNMNPGGENHREFSERGWLLPDNATYNAYYEPARKLYWEQAKRELFNGGFDGWWCDSSEGFCRSDWSGAYLREPWERFILGSGDLKRHIDPDKVNAFCVVHARSIYDGQRGDTDEKRVINLTRSGYPSIQKYGAILWSGDVAAKWSTLRKQVAEGARFCMSGLPYWTNDTGAFFASGGRAWAKRMNKTEDDITWFRCGDYDDGAQGEGYREFFTRWLEYAAFLPVFRVHGTDTAKEIWRFGEKGTMFYDAIEKFIRLRYRLIPYIYSMAGMVTQEDYTMLRGLAFDFMDDKKARVLDNEFMFGPAFLVAPVTRPMYFNNHNEPLEEERKQTCYLPQGADWYDFWDGTFYKGGREVTVETPIDRIPLFVRAGSVIPMTDVLQHTGEEHDAPLQIRIYPGANGSFRWYEDSGDSYDYEKGAFATADFTWDDASRTLTLSKRTGSYAGMGTRKVAAILGDNCQEAVWNGDELKFRF